VKNIYQRLNDVRRAVRGVSKERLAEIRGRVSYKYGYTGHEDVTAAVRDLYVVHGIDVEVSCMSWERTSSSVAVGRVQITWRNIDDPADFKMVTMPCESMGNPGVAVGQAVSYAVKVAELKNLQLIGEADDDLEAVDRPLEHVKTVPEPDVERPDPKSPPDKNDLAMLLTLIAESEDPEGAAEPFLEMNWTKAQKKQVGAAIENRLEWIARESDPTDFPYGDNS